MLCSLKGRNCSLRLFGQIDEYGLFGRKIENDNYGKDILTRPLERRTPPSRMLPFPLFLEGNQSPIGE